MKRALLLLVCLLVVSPGRAQEPPAVEGPSTVEESSTVDGPFAAEATTGACARPIRFGFSPYLTAGLLRSAFEPVIEYMGRELGVPFDLVIPEHYVDMLTLLQEGAIDLAYLTPALYVKARKADPTLRLLVTDVWHGVDFYTGYLAVLSKSGIDAIEALRGLRIVYVDRESASGFLLPRAALRALGVQPDAFFGEVRYSGDHLRSLDMLLGGEVDVAALSSDTLATARRQRRDVGRVRILMKTGEIPHDVICATSALPDDLAARLTELLLSLNCRTPEGRAVLPKVPRLNGWRLGNPADYDEIERLLTIDEGATP